MVQDQGEQLLNLAGHKKKASAWTAALAVVCQMAGMGILQLPYMLRQGGWLCLVLILGCAVATNYTGKLLVRCCYDENGSRLYSSYEEIGTAAFGRPGRAITVFFENATLFGVSTLFLILGGKFLEEIFETFVTVDIAPRVWILIGAAAVAIPVLFIQSIGELKIISWVGVLAVATVVVAVVVEAMTGRFESEHPADVSTDLFLPGGFVPAFSAMALAFAAHAGLPTVELNMRDPQAFPRALNLAYALVMILYMPVAIVGYAVYGNGVYSPILCSLPRDNWVQVAAKTLVTAHVLLTYPVLMTLFLTGVERNARIEPGTNGYLAKRTLLRTLVVAATAGCAVFVPYFDTMMSFIGAICVIMTTFIMPATFYLKLQAKTAAQRVVPVIVAVVGTVGGTIGAVQAGIELVQKVSAGADPNAG
eukprot:TRINITY_DN74414_c0_g1_i1.p1 TRINITY_DN74414_c0_g1~~TRINITY_DN74414_c0_g1_i1.p1  ORF type:complete len:420 (+),score=86.10 TRINITY_DN74414_c0_g1_i1:76-1335(+)